MKDLLIVVDYQHDFVDGALGFKGAETIYRYILSLIEKFSHEGNDIVFTKDTHFHDYLSTEEGKHLPVKHCIENTNGHQFYQDLESISNKYPVFKKFTFGSSELLKYLETHPYKTITLVGLVSHICVLSNAVIAKSALPNAHIIVDTKGVDSFDKDLEKQAFNVLKGLHIELRWDSFNHF